MLGFKNREHLGRIVEVQMELATFGSFLRTVCHGVVNRLAPDDMTRVCDDDDLSV